jgi:hypothetical protein
VTHALDRQTITDYMQQHQSKLWTGCTLIDGILNVFKEGENADVDIATTPESVWAPGGSYPFQTAGFTASIKSNDTNDTLLGTGARKVRIDGLDASRVRQTETVSMNGTTSVSSTRTDWLRINSTTVVDVGTGGENAGIIDLTVTNAAGASQSRIPVGHGVDDGTVYSISDVSTGFLTELTTQIVGGTSGDTVKLQVFTKMPMGAWKAGRSFNLEQGSVPRIHHIFEVPVVLMSEMDLEIRVVSASADNTKVAASVVLVDVEDWVLEGIRE